MQQRKETGHTEVISIEEYLTKRKKIRDMDRSQRRGRIPEENQTLILAVLYILLEEMDCRTGEISQNIRSSARRIFDGAAVAVDRRSNEADGRIGKEVWLNIRRSAH